MNGLADALGIRLVTTSLVEVLPRKSASPLYLTKNVFFNAAFGLSVRRPCRY